jgi:hypothetical protein
MALSIKTLGTMTLSIMSFFATLSITVLSVQCNCAKCRYVGCRVLFYFYAQCHYAGVVMLGVVAPFFTCLNIL